MRHQDAIGGALPAGLHLEIGTTTDDGRGRAGGDVIGVVDDVRDQDPDAPAEPTVCLAHDQFPTGFLTFMIKAAPGQFGHRAPARARGARSSGRSDNAAPRAGGDSG